MEVVVFLFVFILRCIALTGANVLHDGFVISEVIRTSILDVVNFQAFETFITPSEMSSKGRQISGVCTLIG